MTRNEEAPTHRTVARDPGRWLALGSVIMAVLAAVFDGALMGLIAPAVASDLGADAATIGLIASITTLMLAAFILGGGTLGDIYGRKRFLIYGIVGLSVTSLLAMIVPTAGLLIPVRALSGIMAALVNPLALAIVTVTFDEEERPTARPIKTRGKIKYEGLKSTDSQSQLFSRPCWLLFPDENMPPVLIGLRLPRPL